jgi:hypothetical protein
VAAADAPAPQQKPLIKRSNLAQRLAMVRKQRHLVKEYLKQTSIEICATIAILAS